MGDVKIYFQSFLALALLKIVLGFGAFGGGGVNTGTTFKMNSITFDTIPNPYIVNWSGVIRSDKEAVSFKLPIEQDLPDSMMLKVDIEYMGNSVFAFEMPLCDSFNDEVVAKDVVLRGTPVGEFPTECPIKAGSNFEVENYEIPTHKIPQGSPDGSVVAMAVIYETGNEPYLTIRAEGDIKNNVPGFGR